MERPGGCLPRPELTPPFVCPLRAPPTPSAARATESGSESVIGFRERLDVVGQDQTLA